MHFEAKKLDDTMWLDVAFVEEQYEELMEKKLKQHLMDVLPERGEKISLPKALVAAELISGGDLAATQKKSLINVLNSAVSMLTDVSEGRGPSLIELGKMEDYVVTFAKRVENFCWIDMHEI